MLLPDWPALNAVIDFFAHGLLRLSWWQVVLCTLVATHITIAAVTIYLHRSQAHRALDLGPIPSHFFRFWLWVSTGMLTKQWVAIHRKHHAKCETEEDPHSPMTRGIKTVLLQGAELYRAEAKNEETMAKYGHGTPNDWVENHVYTRFPWQGVGLMLIVDVLLFGAAGATVWAVQMLWIPINAAGIINGIGHFWGYRNFESPDTSTNVSPWGFIIGGEELHNNHHTYPTSAKFSIKPYEFDLGWGYIRAMEMIGWAKVKKVAPKLQLGEIRPVADEKTLEAIIANRYEVMAGFARELRRAAKDEITLLQAKGQDMALMKAARHWLHRDDDWVPVAARKQVAQARAASPVIDQMLTMRDELRQVWLNTSHTRSQLAADLQAWCQRAEASGIARLQTFSQQLRAAHA